MMQEINPNRVSPDSGKPSDVYGIEKFRERAVFCPDAEITAREEQKQPREKREIVRGHERAVVQTEREQHADVVCFLREIPLKKPADTDKTVLNIPRQHKKQRENNYPDKRRQIIEQLLAKPENHHGNSKKMQNAKVDGNAAEKRRDEGNNHSEEEALRSAFYVVL